MEEVRVYLAFTVKTVFFTWLHTSHWNKFDWSWTFVCIINKCWIMTQHAAKCWVNKSHFSFCHCNRRKCNNFYISWRSVKMHRIHFCSFLWDDSSSCKHVCGLTGSDSDLLVGKRIQNLDIISICIFKRMRKTWYGANEPLTVYCVLSFLYI